TTRSSPSKRRRRRSRTRPPLRARSRLAATGAPRARSSPRRETGSFRWVRAAPARGRRGRAPSGRAAQGGGGGARQGGGGGGRGGVGGRKRREFAARRAREAHRIDPDRDGHGERARERRAIAAARCELALPLDGPPFDEFELPGECLLLPFDRDPRIPLG